MKSNETKDEFQTRKEQYLNSNVANIWQDIDKVIEENKDKFDKIEKKFENNVVRVVGEKNIKDFKEGLGGNLQYFKTDLIHVERIDKVNDKKLIEFTERAGQMIAIKENTFEEIEINDWFQIFESKDKKCRTAIYFREDMSEITHLVEQLDGYKTTLYMFSYNGIDKKMFNNLADNILIEDIPEPILAIYKEINLTIKGK